MIDNLFGSVYKNKKVFITGNTGFKGSWLAFWLHKLGADVTGLSLPEKTSPAHHDLLKLKIRNLQGDVRDKAFVEKCLIEAKPEIVFHLAAQSLVHDSYRDPTLTYETNVIGTLNIFEAVRKVESIKALVNVTTDKVYDNKEWHWPYRENDQLGGYDLYSSSKACSEILTASYRNSFFNTEQFGKIHQVLLASARAGNVIGGGDWAKDRLIPDVVRAAVQKQAVDVRSPRAIRPWEHVLEPLSGYLLLGQKLLEGKAQFASAWNFGPDSHHFLQVSQVLNLFQKRWPEMQWLNKEDQNNAFFHEASILKLDCSKAMSDLKWQPVLNIEETIEYTAEWYKNFYQHNVLDTEKNLSDYIGKAFRQQQTWTMS